MILLPLSSLPTFSDRKEMMEAASDRSTAKFRPLPAAATLAATSASLTELSARADGGCDQGAVEYVGRTARQAEGARVPYKPGSYHYIREGRHFTERCRDLLGLAKT